MKLTINKASDLSSISVFPPHARRPNLGPPPGTEASKAAAMSQPLRHAAGSQSQHSFSQSQLSQSSFDENLATDQRFGSQERDNSSKRICALGPITSYREESQLPLSRPSNNVVRRWSSSSLPDNKCQVSEELEHRFHQMESSLNRMGIILDSIQNDVMQVNRATREVTLDTEGIRQKMISLEDSMQQLQKGEEGIKGSLDECLKSISDKEAKDLNCKTLNEIKSAISALPQQIEAHFSDLQNEIYRINNDMKVIVGEINSLKLNYLSPLFSRVTSWMNSRNNQQVAETLNRENAGMLQYQRNHKPKENISKIASPVQNGWTTVLKVGPGIPQTLKPRLTDQKLEISKDEEADLRSQSNPQIRSFTAVQQHSERNQIAKGDIQLVRPPRQKGWTTVLKLDSDFPKSLQPKLSQQNFKISVKDEEIVSSEVINQKKDERFVIQSDEDSDDVSCILMRKVTEKTSYLVEDSREETMRILQKARKRRRRQASNNLCL